MSIPEPPKPVQASTASASTTDLNTASTQDWSVTGQQTVSGQMDNLLKSDSPYMKQARTSGLQQATSRGLLNSSMAAGAAQGAAIGRALPIATQDAATFANSAQFNAQSQTEINKFNADAANRVGMFNTEAKNNANQFNASAANNAANLNYQGDMQLHTDHVRHLNDLEKLGLQITANERQLPLQFAGNLSATLTNGINAIMADGSLNAAAKQTAIKNLTDYGNSQLAWARDFYNINIPNMNLPEMA